MTAHPRHRDFILANTRLLSPPLVPELRLHLAEESLPIWQKSEEELGQMNVPPPYWAFAWAGGQALARYLIDNPDVCRNQSVIDLGAGSGLTALAAKKAGAAHVLAADIDPIALVACELNAQLNEVSLETTAEDLLEHLPAASVLLVGDLFYERQLANRVAMCIEAARQRGMAVLIGDPKRSYFPSGRYRLVAEYSVPVSRELEDAEIKKTAVWKA